MVVTTTPSIEGKVIKEYLGVVAGDAVEGVNIIKDFFAGVRDIVGGRSTTYEKVLDNARETAFLDLKKKASMLGANAVVGLGVDYCIIGNSMMLVSATGTAVVVE